MYCNVVCKHIPSTVLSNGEFVRSDSFLEKSIHGMAQAVPPSVGVVNGSIGHGFRKSYIPGK